MSGRLPQPPNTYGVRWAAELVRALEQQQQQAYTSDRDVEVFNNRLWLKSANGTRYQLIVNNDGSLTTAAAAPAALPPPPASILSGAATVTAKTNILARAEPAAATIDGAATVTAVSTVTAAAVALLAGRAMVAAGASMAAAGVVVSGITNLLQYSEQFNRSVWATTLTPNVAPEVSNDPFSQQTVDELSVSYSGSNYVRQHVAGLVIGQAYTFSAWVQQGRAGSAARTRLTTNNTAAWNTGASAVYSLTGTLERVSVTWTQTDTTTAALMIGSVAADGTGDDTCLGTVRLFGAMLNTGTAPAAYVKTQIDPPEPVPAPSKIFAAYYEVYHAWQGAPYPQITAPRNDRYNTLYIFHCKINADGSARYDHISDTTADEIQTCRNRGQKLILTVGGSGAAFVYDTRAKITTLRDSLFSIITTLGGVDGVDWNNYEGDTVLTPANRDAVADQFIWIAGELRTRYGSNFILSTPAAPNDDDQRYFCQRLFDANALTYAAPQYYDADVFRDDNFITNSIAFWVNNVARGDASKIAVGFGATYFSPYAPLGGPDDIINEREWRRIRSNHPNIRGMFGWAVHNMWGYGQTRTNTGAPDVWSNRMFPLL